MAYIDHFFHVFIELRGLRSPSGARPAAKNPPPRRNSADPRGGAHPGGDVLHAQRNLLGRTRWQRFEELGDLDFAYEMDEENRFRVNYLKQVNGYGAVFRIIPTKIKTLDELGIPKVVKTFGEMRGGIVLVTGPTGSGKSTTLAALMDYININFSRHIITIEEPIEFVHRNKKSIITQREVPEHSISFPSGPESGPA